MSVRAKFKVDRIERSSWPKAIYDESGKYLRSEPQEMQTIVMSPVAQNNDPNSENTRFWNASPSGELRLGCINLEAAKQFDLGKEYYIDFTPADGS